LRHFIFRNIKILAGILNIRRGAEQNPYQLHHEKSHIGMLLSTVIVTFRVILLPADMGARSPGIPPQYQENALREDIKAYTEKAVKDKVMSAAEANSIRLFIKDSLPEAQELRISVLQQIRDDIDKLYDSFTFKSDDMESYEYSRIASTMVPKTLREPEGFADPYAKRHQAEINAAVKVKELAAMHLANEKSPVPRWAIWPLRFLFNKGMDTSGKTISVHGGLYYIPVPPGRPEVNQPWTKTIPKAYDD